MSDIYDFRKVQWIRERATDSQIGGILKQHDDLIAERTALLELVADCVHVLRAHRFCGDAYPEDGWDDVNTVLARYDLLKREMNTVKP